MATVSELPSDDERRAERKADSKAAGIFDVALRVKALESILVEKGMVVVERTRVLCEWVEQAPERGPRLPVDRVCVRGCDDVGTSGVHL